MKRRFIIIIAALYFIGHGLIQTNAFDDAAAQEYADRFVTSYNILYKSYMSDCTNFVSQCLDAGGLCQTDHWWYKKGIIGILFDTNSHSWSVANDLKDYMKNDLSAERIAGKWKKRNHLIAPVRDYVMHILITVRIYLAIMEKLYFTIGKTMAILIMPV